MGGKNSGAVSGALSGAAMGFLMGGPMGAAVGGTAGAITGRETVDRPTAKAERKQKADMEMQTMQQERAIKDIEQKQLENERESVAVEAASEGKDALRRRQRSNRAKSAGRQGTILTSPLGVTEEAPSAQKTLLGS